MPLRVLALMIVRMRMRMRMRVAGLVIVLTAARVVAAGVLAVRMSICRRRDG